jgi:hypothetical protein
MAVIPETADRLECLLRPVRIQVDYKQNEPLRWEQLVLKDKVDLETETKVQSQQITLRISAFKHV